MTNLLKGGQGRDEKDVERDYELIGFTIASAAVFLLAVGVWLLWKHFAG